MKQRIEVLLVRGGAVAAGVAALLAGAAQMHGQGQKTYRDPGGAYSVNIPAGWQAQPQQGSPMVSLVDAKTKVSVTLGVMRGPEGNTPTAENELQNIEKQFPQSCPQAKVEQRGATRLAGLSGSFLVVHCNGSDGPQLMKFTAASKPGEVALMVTNSPGNAYLKDVLPLESIRNSFKALPMGGPQGADAMGGPARPGAGSDAGGRRWPGAGWWAVSVAGRVGPGSVSRSAGEIFAGSAGRMEHGIGQRKSDPEQRIELGDGGHRDRYTARRGEQAHHGSDSGAV
jgi:hypothetical protein